MMRKCKELRERWMEDLKLQREQKDKEEVEKKAASLKKLEQEEEQEKKKNVKKDIETIQASISLRGVTEIWAYGTGRGHKDDKRRPG